MANRPELQRKPGERISHKGVARTVRENKREEANERNALTPPERTRAYRRQRNG